MRRVKAFGLVVYERIKVQVKVQIEIEIVNKRERECVCDVDLPDQSVGDVMKAFGLVVE